MKSTEGLSLGYGKKSTYYYKCMRDDIVAMLPKNKKFRSALEIGASGGYTLLYLKNNGIAGKVTGIELFNLPDTEQNNPAFEKFIIGDIGQMNADGFDEAAFDLIICADVLEHLADLWNVRDKLIAWLEPGGILIVSLPNIREYKTILKILLFGTFAYQDEGVMDRTHLRFFCKKDMIRLMSVNGLKIEKIVSHLAFPAGYTKKRVWFNNLTFKLFEEFLSKQYLVMSVKQPVPHH